MTAILKSEMYKYFPEELTRQRIKYGNQTIDIDYRMGNGLYLPKHGNALYLPKKYTKNGEGIAEIVGWVTKNAPVIKDILGVAVPAVNLVGNTAQTIGSTVDTIKKLRDVNLKIIKDNAAKTAISNQPHSKSVAMNEAHSENVGKTGISSQALENILNSRTAKEGKGFYFIK